MDAGVLEKRNPVHGLLEDRLEVLEVLRQAVELEVVWNTVHTPGLGARFECPKQHLPGIFLVVGAFIGYPQNGEGGEAFDRLGQQVEMLAGVQRQGDAGAGRKIAPPHAATVHDDIRLDQSGFAAGFPPHARHAAAIVQHLGDLGIFQDRRAALPRALGERQRDVRRIALPVLGQEDAADHVVDVELRIELRHVVRRDHFGLDIEDTRKRGLPAQLLPAMFGQRHRDRTVLLHACCQAGFGFKTGIKL